MITLADAKQYLKLTATTDDQLIQRIVLAVDAFIKSYCNRNFDEAVYYELYDGDGDNQIILNNYPVCSVSVLSESPDHEDKTYSDKYDAYEFFIYAAEGILETNYFKFSKGQKTIYVQYKAGYGGSGSDKVAVPEDYKLCACEMIVKKYQDIVEKRVGLTSKNLMNENIQFDFKDITDQQQMILDFYKRPATLLKGVTVTQYSQG